MKVTVLVMTYNHERFISQALDSTLMQEVTFDYEILISEDCSTDATRDIVVEYQKRFPETIRLLLSEKNLQSNQIVVRGIQAAKGQYIALLDGDDFWMSPHKLQKQADFLNNHPECTICFHNARVQHEDENRQPWNWTPPDQKEITTLEDLWMGNYIATCSTMFRSGLFDAFPAWYDSMFPITDWPLHILNAEHGKIGYINEVMGTYRYHSGGLYSSLSEARKLEEMLKFYKTMNANLNFKYDGIIKAATFQYFCDWAEEYIKRGNFAQARSCFVKSLSGKPFYRFRSIKNLIVISLKLIIAHVSQNKKQTYNPM
jgi:glycosyltransferase involved in cell wall biosynthesis